MIRYLLISRMVNDLKEVRQVNRFHPEESVFEHTAQVVSHAVKETTDKDLLIAALLHDVGKAKSFCKHADIGAAMIQHLVSEKTHWLVANHMRMHLFNDGKLKRAGKAIKLSSHPWFKDLVMLSRWDMMGRVANITTRNPVYILSKGGLT